MRQQTRISSAPMRPPFLQSLQVAGQGLHPGLHRHRTDCVLLRPLRHPGGLGRPDHSQHQRQPVLLCGESRKESYDDHSVCYNESCRVRSFVEESSRLQRSTSSCSRPFLAASQLPAAAAPSLRRASCQLQRGPSACLLYQAQRIMTAGSSNSSKCPAQLCCIWCHLPHSQPPPFCPCRRLVQ